MIGSPRTGRLLASEAVGACLLLAAIVGSGIMADRLSGGNTGVALLANAIATGGTLTALILAFGPISGAHFNPVVSVVAAVGRSLSWRLVPGYLVAQLTGAVVGVWLAHVMFGEPLFTLSTRTRSGLPQLVSEAVATFGLTGVILSCSRHRPRAIPAAVACYIVGAYWFTASTSFANPAVTVARSLTDTFAGIRPADVPGFVVAQLVGGLAAHAFFSWMLRAPTPLFDGHVEYVAEDTQE